MQMRIANVHAPEGYALWRVPQLLQHNSVRQVTEIVILA